MMGQNQKKVVVMVMISLLLTTPWWLSVPIGTRSFLEEWGNRAPPGSINISRTKFFFPREIEVNGLPLPGGDFGFEEDPHFYGTLPDTVYIEDDDGRSVTLAVQGFDVNFAFSNPHHKVHLLAVSYGERISEFDIAPLKFMGATLGDVHVLALVPEKLVVYAPAFHFPESGTEWSNVLISIDWTETGPGEKAEVLFEGSPEWADLFGKVARAEHLFVDRFCTVQSNTARAFRERVTGQGCAPG